MLSVSIPSGSQVTANFWLSIIINLWVLQKVPLEKVWELESFSRVVGKLESFLKLESCTSESAKVKEIPMFKIEHKISRQGLEVERTEDLNTPIYHLR